MRKAIGYGCAAVVLVLVSAQVALACHVSGKVLCNQSRNPLEGIRIDVVSTDGDPFTATVTSDADGGFRLALPAVLACYTATVVLGEQQQWVVPSDGQRAFCVVDLEPENVLDDFLILDARCGTPQAAQPETWGLLKSAYR